MSDAQRYSPEKQKQPKVTKKTLELTATQLEALKQKIKVMKLQRELNRPSENHSRVENNSTKPRTNAKHKLPDEIKLRKALQREMKKLEDLEVKNPDITKGLEEKLSKHPAREYYPQGRSRSGAQVHMKLQQR